MAEFAYNNIKNASTGHTAFELNCGYHLCVFIEENTNPQFQSKSADKLLAELRDLMILYQKNLYQAQELQKRVYNKSIKPKNYGSSD